MTVRRIFAEKDSHISCKENSMWAAVIRNVSLLINREVDKIIVDISKICVYLHSH